MIQRIQSLYLAMVALLSLLLAKISFLNFIDGTGSKINITLGGIMRIDAAGVSQQPEYVIGYSVFVILILLISIPAIFFYKNRRIQSVVTLGLIVVIIFLYLVSLYYSLSLIEKFKTSFHPGMALFIPVLMLLFSILAYRGIKHDDKLVRSYDRLR